MVRDSKGIGDGSNVGDCQSWHGIMIYELILMQAKHQPKLVATNNA